jgi:hypothetical protein
MQEKRGEVGAPRCGDRRVFRGRGQDNGPGLAGYEPEAGDNEPLTACPAKGPWAIL